MKKRFVHTIFGAYIPNRVFYQATYKSYFIKEREEIFTLCLNFFPQIKVRVMILKMFDTELPYSG